MSPTRRLLLGLVAVSALVLGAEGARARSQGETLDLPAGLAPLEYLTGQWKGQAMPLDNSAQRFRGWGESHSWAWIFKSGKPVGLSVQIKGSKSLASGRLTFDPRTSRYRFEAKTTGAKPRDLVFEGTYDPRARQLQLVSASTGANEAKIRLSIRPNADSIRYTLLEEHQDAGEKQFRRMIQAGLQREGESLAASGSGGGDDKVKCVVTGGAATMSVSYKGQTIPLCCTGCRDEFNDNPEKYIKKLALRMAAESKKPRGAAPARVSARDDAFSDDVVEKPKPAMKKAAAPAAASAAEPEAKPETKTAARSASRPTPASRAASTLETARRLEKDGKTRAALAMYKVVVKSYPRTDAARVAAERIKKLEAE